MHKRFLMIALLAFAVILAGCNKEGEKSSETADTIHVYTTVYPLADFTKKIGGKYVDVDTVYPPGTDEHSFEPSQKDIVSMADADLFFYIGYDLEGFVTKAKPILTNEGVKVLAIGESIDLDENHEAEAEGHEEHDGHNHGSVNPHLWLNPVYAKAMAEKVKEELVAEKPEQKEFFEAQYKQLASQFDQLDQDFAQTIDAASTKKLIVSHAAYGYWEERYGLEQISITGLTASADPSQKELEKIVKTAKENHLTYIIFEQNVSSKLTEIIQKEIGAKDLMLHNLSVLTENDVKNNEDYFSLMEQNLETLKTALY